MKVSKQNLIYFGSGSIFGAVIADRPHLLMIGLLMIGAYIMFRCLYKKIDDDDYEKYFKD